MSDAFMREAARVLPIEQPYDYHRTLKDGPVHRPRRDPAASPGPDEVIVPPEGWQICMHAGVGPLVRTAGDDFRDYLATSM
ncbi:MAG: hypothetical protein HN904_28680, partial [Victivallales bacterium]|nr:hypothetical protein [Victivallales bacterium]